MLFQNGTRSCFHNWIGSSVGLCFLIEYMLQLKLLLCVPCVFVDDVDVVQIAEQKDDGAVFCESLALLRGQLLLEALGHRGRGRPKKLDIQSIFNDFPPLMFGS